MEIGDLKVGDIVEFTFTGSRMTGAGSIGVIVKRAPGMYPVRWIAHVDMHSHPRYSVFPDEVKVVGHAAV